jgi:hypothetical protein
LAISNLKIGSGKTTILLTPVRSAHSRRRDAEKFIILQVKADLLCGLCASACVELFMSFVVVLPYPAFVINSAITLQLY